MYRHRPWAALVALFLLLSAGRAQAVGPSAAKSEGGLVDQAGPSASGFDFGVRPDTAAGAQARGEFDYSVTPGQSVNDRVAVVNRSTRPKTFFIYSADAYNTEIGGSFALRLRRDPASDIAGWIKLNVPSYTVPAQSQTLIPLTLSVPVDATPGDHTAGIVAEELPNQTTAPQGAGLAPVHRVGARVYVRVKGPLHPSLGIKDLVVSHHEPLVPYLTGRGSSTITFTLVNSGNTRVQLDKIEVRLTGLFGHLVHQASVSRPKADQVQPLGLPDQMLPGAQVRLSRPFKGLPAFDRVTANAIVSGEDPLLHQPVGTVRSTPFLLIPWLVIAVVLVLVAGWLLWRRRRRQPPEGSSQPVSTPPGGKPAEMAGTAPFG